MQKLKIRIFTWDWDFIWWYWCWRSWIGGVLLLSVGRNRLTGLFHCTATCININWKGLFKNKWAGSESLTHGEKEENREPEEGAVHCSAHCGCGKQSAHPHTQRDWTRREKGQSSTPLIKSIKCSTLTAQWTCCPPPYDGWRPCFVHMSFYIYTLQQPEKKNLIITQYTIEWHPLYVFNCCAQISLSLFGLGRANSCVRIRFAHRVPFHSILIQFKFNTREFWKENRNCHVNLPPACDRVLNWNGQDSTRSML